MSASSAVAETARTAAIDAAWRQWAALGAPVSSPPATAVIDPEALLLLSCVLRDSERRLDDVLAWWSTAGAGLLSTQRVRTLARRFPSFARAGLAAFSRAAVEGGDARWKTLAAPDEDVLISRGKRGREPRLAAIAALMLRLRAAFGVGVKADLLSVSIAKDGADSTVRSFAQSTGYTAAAIRRAAAESESARVLRSTSARPAAYHVDVARWSAFLGFISSPTPGWKGFAEIYAFLAAVLDWDAGDESGYLLASKARDIFEAHRYSFEINRIPFVEPSDAPGERYLDAFATTVQHLATWLESNV